jgi:hypothetical protein
MAAYEKLRVSVGYPSWSPISSTIRAQRVSVRNAGNVTVTTRTNPDDPLTEDVLAPGVQEVMEFSTRILAGVPIFFARTAEGVSSTLVVTATA